MMGPSFLDMDGGSDGAGWGAFSSALSSGTRGARRKIPVRLPDFAATGAPERTSRATTAGLTIRMMRFPSDFTA